MQSPPKTRLALESEADSSREYAQALTQQLQTQTTRFEQRYQDLVAQFYRVQAQCSQVQTNWRTLQRETLRLHAVVTVKQKVIAVLLPYYPHPLSAEMQHDIDLS